MVCCVNITASLDHLDYDCVVVAGSVHVLSVRSGHFGMRSKHTFTSGEHSAVHSAFYSRPEIMHEHTLSIIGKFGA